MAKKISDKISLLVAVVFAAGACVLRTVQLCGMVEFPSGFYTKDGSLFQLLIYAGLAVMLAALFIAAVRDTKGRRTKDIYDMSKASSSVFGFMMILMGASVFISLISAFSESNMLTIISLLACCLSQLALGIMVFSTARITPPATVCAVIIIAAQFPRMILYYLDNPLLTKVPQKTMMMAFYIFCTLFWFCIGKLFSGGGSRITKASAITFGFVTAIIGISTTAADYVLMGTDADSWLMLTDAPDIEFMVTTLGIAFMTVALLVGCKAENGSEEAADAADTEEETATSDEDTTDNEQQDDE